MSRHDSGGAGLDLDENSYRAFLEGLVESARDGVVLCDPSGATLLVNETARSLGAGDATRRPSPDLLDLDKSPIAFEKQPLARALSERRVIDGEELMARAAEGRLVPVLAGAYPVFGEGGGLLGAVATFRDMTALREADALREKWRSVVSHDLRGPVVTIDLAARLLAEEPGVESDPETQELVTRISRATARLDEMIQNLTDSALVESPRMRLQTETMDVSALVESALESAGIPEDREPRVDIEPELPLLEVDPERLERCLHNLLANAVAHGRAGTPIDLVIRREDGELVFSVANEGAGVPPEIVPRIFERFYKRRTADTLSAEGLGLGLYVTKGFVEAHGGRIWVESEPGRRTVFRFTLPAPSR